jgi:GT2 family glycosyltransferase
MDGSMSPSGNRPLVYVVVLNWNRYELTKRCIDSLLANVYPSLKLIVVDNASIDGSGVRLRSEFATCDFVFNYENLGFARGCNSGIKVALQDANCAYVLLINNDATLAPHGLSKAIEAAEASREIGLVGGKILKSPESKLMWYAGGDISLWRGQAKSRGFRELDHGQYDNPCDVRFVTGGLMLIKRSVLEKVGLLPEEYFFGVEEWDFSMTTRKWGFRLRYVPELVAFHKGDGSHWNYDPKYVYNYYRNKLIFQEKFLPKGVFPLWKILLLMYQKYWARQKFQRTMIQFDWERPGLLDDLEFALAEAIKDHNKGELSEHTLKSFEAKLAKRKAASAGAIWNI